MRRVRALGIHPLGVAQYVDDGKYELRWLRRPISQEKNLQSAIYNLKSKHRAPGNRIITQEAKIGEGKFKITRIRFEIISVDEAHIIT